MKMNAKNQSGVGLLEIVVGLGLLSGVVYGLMTFMKDMSKSKATHMYREDVQAWTNEIFKTLSDRDACKNTFANMMAASDSATVIKDKNGNVKFSVGTSMGSQGVKISSLSLVDVTGMDDAVEVKPGEPGSTRLVIKFTPVLSSQTSSYEVQKSINLFVLTTGTTTANATIKECYSLVNGGSLLWSKDPLNANNIYYKDGFVGVGIENPQTALDVGGPVAVTNGIHNVQMIGNSAQFNFILTDITRPFEFLNNVSGGWADVQGRNFLVDSYIQLSSTADPCDATANGSIRYNSSTKQVEMCEGGAWVAKAYEEWCVPTRRNYENDDNAMWFHQSDTARREKGTGCDRDQIDERADNTNYSDLKIGNPDYGYRVHHDDSSNPCVNDQSCQTWRDIDQ
ncbi:MAG: hypothetical protein ACJ76H_12975 [Bacteriovoracaceae bacterium]